MKRTSLKTDNILFWLPRILGIIFILFLALFALDVFIPGKSIGYYLVALFMHLIPNFILLSILLIAWKWEKLGGRLFLLSFIILLAWFGDRSFFGMQFLLFSPLLLIGVLFLLHSYMARTRRDL